MTLSIKRLAVRNYRALADVSITLDPLNVLFGPNGAGKSTLLDAIWFVHECAERGVDVASSARSHGIGARWMGAEPDANIEITLDIELVTYTVSFGYSAGRIDPFVGEILRKADNTELIRRAMGSDQATFDVLDGEERMMVPLREPEKLAFTRYLDMDLRTTPAAFELNRVLKQTRRYLCREAALDGLRKRGSEISPSFTLLSRAQNLWSVLQNIMGRQAIDDRFETILNFMRRAYPSFTNIVIETTAPGTVYASYQDSRFADPIPALGMSDGQLQLLLLLTALFSDNENTKIVIFDEPEISLHPHALTVFAEAVKLATTQWNKQVLIATHSPVLISQFAPENILAMEVNDQGRTVIKRLTEIEGIGDLLEQYAAGSLYMAQVIGKQA